MFIPTRVAITIRRVLGIMEIILQQGQIPVQENVLPVASSEISLVVVEVLTVVRIIPEVLIPEAAVPVKHLLVAAVPANHLPVAAAAAEEDPKLLLGNSDPVLN